MEEVMTAIYSQFTANATLSAAITGGLYHTEAKQEVDFPYGVYFLVSDVPLYTFTEIAENCLIQFNCFSETRSEATIQDIFTKLKACYDLCDLIVSGYNHIYMMREFANIGRIENVWQLSVTYRCEVQKSR